MDGLSLYLLFYFLSLKWVPLQDCAVGLKLVSWQVNWPFWFLATPLVKGRCGEHLLPLIC